MGHNPSGQMPHRAPGRSACPVLVTCPSWTMIQKLTQVLPSSPASMHVHTPHWHLSALCHLSKDVPLTCDAHEMKCFLHSMHASLVMSVTL